MNRKQKKMLIRILIAAALMVVIRVLYAFLGEGEDAAIKEPFWFLMYMVPYLTVGYDILRKALKGIKNRQVFDENFLMAVATVGVIALALIKKNGDYTDGIAVMLFYQVGELFQS